MFRSVSRFKKIFSAAAVILVCSYFGYFRLFAGEEPVYSKGGYLIFAADPVTEDNIRWAKYFYDHLKRRAENPEAVAYGTAEDDLFGISVRLDPEMKNDYEIRRSRSGLKLMARDNEKMLWLQYQVMKKIGEEDAGIAVADLPPAIIPLSDISGTFAFEYRGIYAPANRDPDYSAIIGTDNADGWGLWGHNLQKAVGKDAPDEVYAWTGGKRVREQWCFSAEETYRRIEDYIRNTYGDGKEKSMRFVVAPEDCPLVCTCPDCIRAGNTTKNATPAVTGLVTRLAGRFPGHVFFTTSYLSTKEPPTTRLPRNAGVIVSAMDLPLRSAPASRQYERFETGLTKWKKATDKVYVWDYINNFDDYLTPFPVLNIMRHRLQFFRKQQVSGVFLNGSGYDYSSFDGLKTYVLSAVLIDPDLPVDGLVRAYLKQYFPATGTKLNSFYIGLETRAGTCKVPLNMYGGIADAMRTFLDVPEFVRFYEELETLVPVARDEERKELKRLLTALTFTRLEIARSQAYRPYGCADKEGDRINIKPEMDEWLNRLNECRAFPDMERYRETGGENGKYVEEWRKYIMKAGQSGNLLAGRSLHPLFTPDENYTDFSILTDGIAGLPGNYHCGWLIASVADPEIVLPVDAVRRARTFGISFLYDPRHGINLPRCVRILKNGKVYKEFAVDAPDSGDAPCPVYVSGSVGLEDAESLSVKIVRPEDRKPQIAVDEIRFIP